MQDKNAAHEAHRVNGSIGIALPIFNHLENTRRSEPLQRPRLLMLLADLSQIERVTENINNVFGERQQVSFAAPYSV